MRSVLGEQCPEAKKLLPTPGPQMQKVISSLQYNHNNGYYYNVSKNRPYARIMDTARDTLRLALPIK